MHKNTVKDLGWSDCQSSRFGILGIFHLIVRQPVDFGSSFLHEWINLYQGFAHEVVSTHGISVLDFKVPELEVECKLVDSCFPWMEKYNM
jgi:hypothetical protein